jgi:hypothetical protein
METPNKITPGCRLQCHFGFHCLLMLVLPMVTGICVADSFYRAPGQKEFKTLGTLRAKFGDPEDKDLISGAYMYHFSWSDPGPTYSVFPACRADLRFYVNFLGDNTEWLELESAGKAGLRQRWAIRLSDKRPKQRRWKRSRRITGTIELFLQSVFGLYLVGPVTQSAERILARIEGYAMYGYDNVTHEWRENFIDPSGRMQDLHVQPAVHGDGEGCPMVYDITPEEQRYIISAWKNAHSARKRSLHSQVSISPGASRRASQYIVNGR